jgi:hypothetical protein
VGETAVTTDGGQSPQALVNRTALDIFRSDMDAVLIGGAGSWRSRMAYKAIRARILGRQHGRLGQELHRTGSIAAVDMS